MPIVPYIDTHTRARATNISSNDVNVVCNRHTTAVLLCRSRSDDKQNNTTDRCSPVMSRTSGFSAGVCVYAYTRAHVPKASALLLLVITCTSRKFLFYCKILNLSGAPSWSEKKKIWTDQCWSRKILTSISDVASEERDCASSAISAIALSCSNDVMLMLP